MFSFGSIIVFVLSVLFSITPDKKIKSNPGNKGVSLSKPGKRPLIYDEDLVEHIGVNGKYDAIMMSRKGERIKAKYFAGRLNGLSVQERYLEWAKGRNVIMYTSGCYMDLQQHPVGLTIDNGAIVNRKMENFDGLVIVYATGGVVATNLKDGNLKMKCSGNERNYDLRNGGGFSKDEFLDCASRERATVFQTHLLVYKDQLLMGYNSSPVARERRFLAVCQNPDTKELKHVIVNTPVSAAASLKGATEQVQKFLRSIGAGSIVFLINLDTGYQDVFKYFDSNGNVVLRGEKDLDAAANLLVYYYE
jgi:hypothetical protein